MSGQERRQRRGIQHANLTSSLNWLDDSSPTSATGGLEAGNRLAGPGRQWPVIPGIITLYFEIVHGG
jgi:hypothetical protein